MPPKIDIKTNRPQNHFPGEKGKQYFLLNRKTQKKREEKRFDHSEAPNWVIRNLEGMYRAYLNQGPKSFFLLSFLG